MNHDAKGTIKRAERFQVILIGEGILVGAIAGFVVLFYRIVLGYAGQWTQKILTFTKGNLLRMAGWLIVLVLLACVVARLLKYESMISGSGIPQLEGEMAGKLDQVWWKVLPSKFLGGFLCMLGGLALGREGPSIQLGAMVGKGISRGLDRGKTEENRYGKAGHAGFETAGSFIRDNQDGIFSSGTVAAPGSDYAQRPEYG